MSVDIVYSEGIYHGLPVFDEGIKSLTAIVTGANGISGNYMLRVLGKSPQRWKRIICLSRRPPAIADGLPNNAEHIPLDFLKDPKEIAQVLQQHNVTADYIFFYTYMQAPPKDGGALWSDAEEMTRINKLLLDNFLAALTQANIKPKRFMLQTGAKHYGTHLGPAARPQEESDPVRHLHEWEPNFYYPQEDSLFEWAKQNDCGWNVCMPSFILGAVPDAAINAAYPLAVYAALRKHLGQPLEFPSDVQNWQAVWNQSSSYMNGHIEEWAVLTEKMKDQRLNVSDDCMFSWEKFWPRVAGWYGIKWTGPDTDEQKFSETPTPYDPPPRGYGGPGKLRLKFSITEWVKKPEVIQAWKELAQKHDLVSEDLGDVDRIFQVLDGQISMRTAGGIAFSMDKAKKLGWHGFVDTNESYLSVFNEYAKMKMIPPVPMADVRFS